MARARNIKPGFFTNDELAELPALTRLLFIGIWTLVDRCGRIEDRPKKIKAECMPYDDMDIDAALQELCNSGFILRYEAGGIRCIQVKNWDKHQNPHIKEHASIIQAPNGYGSSTVQAPDKEQPNPEPARLIPDSGFRIPDSGSLIPDSRDSADKPAPVSRLISLKTYLSECKAIGVKPIPDDHFIRAYCRDAGIVPDMVALAWVRFREEHTTGTRKGKKYIDWPGTFANSVKDRWYRLWMANDEGAATWTSEGLQARRVADAKTREAEHEPA